MSTPTSHPAPTASPRAQAAREAARGEAASSAALGQGIPQGVSRIYRGRTVEELIPKIQAELGADAVVLRREKGLTGGFAGFFQRPFVEIEARSGTPQIDRYDEDGTPALPEAPPPSDPSPAVEQPEEFRELTPASLVECANARDRSGAPVSVWDNEPFAAALAEAEAAVPAPPVGPSSLATGALPAVGGPHVDGGRSTDGQIPANGGVSTNGHIPAGSGVSANGYIPANGGIATNGSPHADGGISTNGNPHTDGGISTNGHIPTDSGISINGQIPAGSGISTNGNPHADGGISTNGHIPTDSGISVNGQIPAGSGISANGYIPANGGIATNGYAANGGVPVTSAHPGTVIVHPPDPRSLRPPAAFASPSGRTRVAIERALAEVGMGEEFARELIETAAAHVLPLMPARPSLARAVHTALRQRIPSCPPLGAGGATIAVVGPGGSGKTACCTALLGAYRRRSTLSAACATILPEPTRSARGELAMLLSPHILEPLPVRDRGALAALRSAREDGLLLLDTPAVSPADSSSIRALTTLLQELQPDRVVLTLPATLGARPAAQLLEALRPLGASTLAITHAEETDQLGVAVQAACDFSIPPAYLLERPERGRTGGGLIAVDPIDLADRLLPPR